MIFLVTSRCNILSLYVIFETHIAQRCKIGQFLTRLLLILLAMAIEDAQYTMRRATDSVSIEIFDRHAVHSKFMKIFGA